MVTRPALYVWWRGCFLMRCLEAPLPCRSLSNFNVTYRYLYKRGGEVAREEAGICFRFSRRHFLHKAVKIMDVLIAAGERWCGAWDAVTGLVQVASSPLWLLWSPHAMSFPCRKRRNAHGGRQNGEPCIVNGRSKWQFKSQIELKVKLCFHNPFLDSWQ